MEARVLDLPFDVSRLDGLSEQLLRSHHQNNYSGAVKRLNAIRGELRIRDFGTTPGVALNGLEREKLIAMNPMLLHESYFDNLTACPQPMAPAMDLALSASKQRQRRALARRIRRDGQGAGRRLRLGALVLPAA